MNARVDTSKTPSNTSTMDTAQMVLAVLLLIGGIVGYYWFAEESGLLRGGVLAVGLIGALALTFLGATGRRARTFMGESRFEMRKIVWPTRQETTQTTIVVVIVVIVISIMLWLIDMLLGWAILDVLLKSKS